MDDEALESLTLEMEEFLSLRTGCNVFESYDTDVSSLRDPTEQVGRATRGFRDF